MNKTEHLLTCLAEECAEVGQAAAKALRFGVDGMSPNGGLPNKEYIVREVNDVLAIIELLIDHGLKLDGIGDQIAIDEKKAKVAHFMEYAEKRGTLVRRET